MTMHLLGPQFSTISTRKRKKTLTDNQYHNMCLEWAAHNKQMKKLGCKPESLDDYIARRLGKYKAPVKAPVRGPFDTKAYTRETPKYPSLSDTSLKDHKKNLTNACAKKEANVYSGERKLLGIAVMHKSNLVPVFDREDAAELAKMRRG
jgi:hypothetical protein